MPAVAAALIAMCLLGAPSAIAAADTVTVGPGLIAGQGTRLKLVFTYTCREGAPDNGYPPPDHLAGYQVRVSQRLRHGRIATATIQEQTYVYCSGQPQTLALTLYPEDRAFDPGTAYVYGRLNICIEDQSGCPGDQDITLKIRLIKEVIG